MAGAAIGDWACAAVACSPLDCVAVGLSVGAAVHGHFWVILRIFLNASASALPRNARAMSANLLLRSTLLCLHIDRCCKLDASDPMSLGCPSVCNRALAVIMSPAAASAWAIALMSNFVTTGLLLLQSAMH